MTLSLGRHQSWVRSLKVLIESIRRCGRSSIRRISPRRLLVLSKIDMPTLKRSRSARMAMMTRMSAATIHSKSLRVYGNCSNACSSKSCNVHKRHVVSDQTRSCPQNRTYSRTTCPIRYSRHIYVLKQRDWALLAITRARHLFLAKKWPSLQQDRPPLPTSGKSPHGDHYPKRLPRSSGPRFQVSPPPRPSAS